jgi:LuxR family maltose regulon positive regulatory protein
MSTPILAMKLYIPAARSKVVPRPRLIERLKERLNGKLTLISAPAGFGKTTLISEWVAQCGRPTAWLSLDEWDSDFTRFLSYFIAAIQTVAPHIGSGIIEILQSPQPPANDVLLTTLLNEIATIQDPFLLVLDDYHLLDSRAVDQALIFLLEHLPPQMHLVITTREDPNLPLARLRARSQLTELRAAELRFTAAEAVDFLNQVMGLSLSADDIRTLEERTEGWIAGLQLAAISLQGSADTAGFIQAFAGDHRYILDYLAGEVLEQQPEAVRQFLLQTAILERLNGSLCDAVTGQQGGSEQLKALERGNFFVIPLDDKRLWYRYHHLFGQVLYTRLMAEQGDQVAVLHQRASVWYEQNEMFSDAVYHGLAAEDFERVATVIEQSLPSLRRNRREATLVKWLRMLPESMFESRPVLTVHFAGALMQSGDLNGVDARLRDAERWLETAQKVPAEKGELSDEDFHSLPGWIAVYRAALALIGGRIDDTVTYARRGLDHLREDDHLERGAAAGLLGLAYWTLGDLESGYQSYFECMTRLEMIGHFSDVLGCSIALADIRIDQGRLREAMRAYEHGLQLVTRGTHVLRGAADMQVGMSQLYCEWNDLTAAKQQLLQSQELGELAGLPQNDYRWRVAMARIAEAEGDVDSALDWLAEAEPVYRGDFFPNVHPIAAMKARIWAAQGKIGEALNWARERHLSAEDEPSYLQEFEHITLAKVLLAQYQADADRNVLLEATGLLERLLQAAQAGQRTGNVIEILILQALAHQMHGDMPAALMVLERALKLAEPEGYVRMFVSQVAPMAGLLEMALKQGIMPNYARQLLKAFSQSEEKPARHQGLTEPLSEREMDVLRLLGTDLDGPEIASQLIVSLNTLRTHTKNIYTKLGVNNRRSAIRRAEELGLL